MGRQAVRQSPGCEQEKGGTAPFCSARRSVLQGRFLLIRELYRERSRPSAIQIDCLDTSLRQELLSQLFHSKAVGMTAVSSIYCVVYHGAVIFYTESGPRIGRQERLVPGSRVGYLTVIHNHIPGACRPDRIFNNRTVPAVRIQPDEIPHVKFIIIDTHS